MHSGVLPWDIRSWPVSVDPIQGSLTQLEDLGMLPPEKNEIPKLAIHAEISPA